MWWLVSAAVASDGTDGVRSPGAGELGSVASVGLTGGGGIDLLGGGRADGGIEASIGLSDRWALVGYAQVVHQLATEDAVASTVPGGLLSLRFVAFDRDVFRLAPMLTATASATDPTGGSLGLGLAVEGGGEKLRFDATAPSFVSIGAGVRDGEYGLWPSVGIGTGEIGLTGAVGDRHELRLGLPWLGTWRYRADHVYVEASATFLIVTAAAAVEVGARF